MNRARHHAPITEERLENALTLMAYIVMRHGPVYAPHFDKIERELLDYRQKHQSVEDRMRRLVGSQILSGGTKAIR